MENTHPKGIFFLRTHHYATHHSLPSFFSPHAANTLHALFTQRHQTHSVHVKQPFSDLCPRVEEATSSPLHDKVSPIARGLATVLQGVDIVAEAGQVVLHPAGPVATVTAMDEVGALQENPCPSHHWCFLSNVKILFRYTRCCCFRGLTQWGHPVHMQLYTDRLSFRPVDIQTQTVLFSPFL